MQEGSAEHTAAVEEVRLLEEDETEAIDETVIANMTERCGKRRKVDGGKKKDEATKDQTISVQNTNGNYVHELQKNCLVRVGSV